MVIDQTNRNEPLLIRAGFVALFIWFGLFCPALLQAQEYRGSLQGIVRDPSGAVIPGARVTVKNAATNVALSVETSTQGVYTAPDLAPGTYAVTVNKPGFETLVHNNIEISTGQTLGLNLTLQVGSETQEVVVTALSPMLDTESGSGGTVLNGQLVSSLPVFGSNTFNLENLTPGVNNGGAGAIQYAARPFDNGGEDNARPESSDFQSIHSFHRLAIDRAHSCSFRSAYLEQKRRRV